MKIKHMLIALLTLVMILSLFACDKGVTEDTTDATPTTATPTDEVTTEPVTEAPTTPVTETPTEEVTEAPAEDATESSTEEATEDATEEETQPGRVKKYREDWDEDDPENPFYNLIPVGKSYDGRTDCYDGRYDFGYTVCRTNDGEYFTSVQEAVWYLEDIGGGSILMTDHTDICLKLEIPEDYCDYRIYYQFLNVDFVFNYGNIYDDCSPNAEGINGYAYYADLYVLDGFNNLGDTHVWIIKNEDFPDEGRYLMLDEPSDDPDYGFRYLYTADGVLKEWPGLPLGEYLPDY